MTRQRLVLTAMGLGLATWGGLRARLTFGLLPERLTLVFDGSCDFCTRSVRLVRALDREGRIAIEPFQKPGFPESHSLTVAQCERSVWAITPDGFPYPAAAAINFAIATALRSALPLWFYALPGITALQEAGYHLIAQNRHLIPGDRPYCEQYPEECGKVAASAAN
jgi:predicted DCC family thiol-disulfide oxidoreductase YuxK